MPDGYGTHRDYIGRIDQQVRSRQQEVETALKDAFANFLETRSVDVVIFSNVGVMDLANAIRTHPVILKPLLTVCNIAGRAIERDLQIKNVDTYKPRLSHDHVTAIAGYLKPFLPAYLEIPAIAQIDRVAFVDKEIRKGKGRWEKAICDALNRFGTLAFKKRKFIVEKEGFELDAAAPETGPIQIGIDVKRIEARRDIHKRCDEIVNKATKFKQAHKAAKFAAVIYYPFIDEHINIQSRLRSKKIDGVFFASESDESVETAVRILLAQFEMAK